jgi:hypothetical protein
MQPASQPKTLRFANAGCQLYSITLPDASLPMVEAKNGFVVSSAGGLVFVDPLAGSTRQLVDQWDALTIGALGDVSVVQSMGRFDTFRSDWTEVGWFGSGAGASRSIASRFYFEDSTGIHRLTSSGGGAAATVTDKVIDADGCHLNFPGTPGSTQSWLTYVTPCSDPKLTAYGTSTERASALPVPADPSQIIFAPAWPKADGDPSVDPFYFLYFAPDAAGTLVLRTPDHTDHTIGQHAALDRTTIASTATGTWGYTLADVQTATFASYHLDLGTFIRFTDDGSTQVLAEHVIRATADLIVNFDGQGADFAVPTDSGISIVGPRVPLTGFRFRDPRGRWAAIMHDSDGPLATLSVTTSSLEFGDAAGQPGPAPSLQLISNGVWAQGQTQFLTSVPGIAYMTNFDANQNTGTLQYRNLELGFTGTVSAGVSDYLSTDDGLIYAVPFGDNSGLWQVRAR